MANANRERPTQRRDRTGEDARPADDHQAPEAVVTAIKVPKEPASRKGKTKNGWSLVDWMRRCPAPEVFDIIQKTRPRDTIRDFQLD